jgi:hypothetical protein
MLDMLSVQGKSEVAWSDRVERAFFRGRDSNQLRLDLIKIAAYNPELLDAGITNFFFFPEAKKQVGTTKQISQFDFFKVNYVTLIAHQN